VKTEHKTTLQIPGAIYNDILNFKSRERIRDNKAAIVKLLKYAFTLPQYFKDFDWKKAEQKADKDIKAKKIASFSSVHGFLADFKA
jgi:hypothetical protein